MLLVKRAPVVTIDPVQQRSSNIARPFRDARVGVTTLLMLGGEVDLPGLVWHDDPGSRCAGVLLVGAVSAAELAATIEVMPDPAMPIADFAGNTSTRSDFTAKILDERTFAAAQQCFAPILERLVEMPFRAAREERSEMLTLRLAYSRAIPIGARFAPGSSNVIHYPLLDSATPKRVELEGLAFLDLLRRRHFMRTHACDHCASNRLLAFEACHACGSSDLADEAIVHHYRCGCQAPESDFIQGNALVCPKCHRGLKHFGMDYGKPGLIVHCRGCGASSPEPEPRFACMDCTATIDGERAKAMDWFHYDLTDAGVLALRAGRLPGGIGRVPLETTLTSRSLREFQLLAIAALRSARKFSRPFTLAQLTPVNLAGLRDQHGSALVDHALEQASAIIARALSDSEFVAASERTILIAFPETAAANAAPLIGQACKAVTAALDLQLDFEIMLCEGDEAIELFSRY